MLLQNLNIVNIFHIYINKIYIFTFLINYNGYMESLKRRRFEKVASKRVQKIIDFIRLLGNCSNRNNYVYSEKDVELMFREINKVLKETKVLYEKNLNKSSKGGFKF
jgi:hypothetical protein